MLAELNVLRSRLDAQVLAAVGAFDAAGDAALDGAASTAAWMRHRLHLAPGTARSHVRTARRIRELPVMSAALSAGEVSAAHVAVVTAAMDNSPARAATIAEAEPIFTTAAKECDPVELGRVVRRWAHTVDPLDELAAEREQHHQRRLSISRTFAGAVAIEGMLPPEAGALVLTALEALGTEDYRATRAKNQELARTGGSGDDGKSAPNERSTPTQRRADALVELCRRYLDSGDAPDIMGMRPHISVTVSQASLAAAPGTVGIEPGDARGDGPGLDRGGPPDQLRRSGDRVHPRRRRAAVGLRADPAHLPASAAPLPERAGHLLPVPGV